MRNIKALGLVVQNLWPPLQFGALTLKNNMLPIYDIRGKKIFYQALSNFSLSGQSRMVPENHKNI